MTQTRLTKWDLRFLAVAKLLSSFSKDPSTKVGCVLADDQNRIVGTGFNGFPAGVDDTDERLSNRELKYLIVQHAERNALAFATKDVTGCTAYVWPIPPCAPCAGGLIQAGIRRIVAPELSTTHERWGNDYDVSLEMYQEAGIIVDFENVGQQMEVISNRETCWETEAPPLVQVPHPKDGSWLKRLLDVVKLPT